MLFGLSIVKYTKIFDFMKKVVLFGDSNTYGRIPGTEERRFPCPVRWTTLLQEALGDSWQVCDEGFPGRSILPQESDPIELNGYDSVLASIERSLPFDIFLIMLGTNDFKTRYKASPEDVLEGMERLVNRVREALAERGQEAVIAIAAPPVFLPIVPDKAELFENGEEKMRAFNAMLRAYAEEEDIPFLDTSSITVDPRDGIHLSEETQPVLARLVHGFIGSICKGGKTN